MIEFFKKIDDITKNIFIDGIWTYLVTSVILAITFIILVKILKRIYLQMKQRRPDAILQLNFIWNIEKTLCIILLIVGLTYQIAPLHNISISLMASSGLLAVFIGAASKDAVSNIVGGFFIAVFKPFSIGDNIKIRANNISGTIEDITTRHTIIRTFNNSRVIVPNNIMNSAILENSNFSDDAVCNFFEIGISYDSDIDTAVEIIQKEALNHKNCIDNRSDEEKGNGADIVPVRVISLAEYSVLLRASIWSTNPTTGFDMMCDLRKNIKNAFDKNNIKIPYPSYDINLLNKI